MTRTIVELSHAVIDGDVGFPGLPAPRIEPYLSHAASRDRYRGLAEFEISRASLVGNSGTYVDSPYHRFPDLADIARIPLERLAGLPGRCLDAQLGEDGRAIVAPDPVPDVAGCAVLLRTGWSVRRGTDAYWEPAPYLSAGLVDALIAGGVSLVGTDSWNVDDAADLSRPAHTRLLAAGVPIVEHLTTLDRLPPSGFRFTAVPPPVQGAASFPVRAFAELDDLEGAAITTDRAVEGG